ncbi:hypothetical protein WPS_16650 [Vulcanimicrobium alpinum]|uniref:Prepilin type IV endopeptidase peptidase domain-containing protein n=1 Tax=Vulcanimicrobium alpinum TaxID=3016050 RepID=A0AAN2C9K3_UNVUL|nr:A24 family peptidase [Vulcanimicrobium alpinum]BDE06389.1 hypothetical protein WPS_16650 [Vulcanimicrobium alpinum]
MSAVSAAVACAGAVAAAAVDARTGVLPNALTRTTAIAALASAAVGGELTPALAGGVCTGGTLLALHLSTGGRGLGLGDVKLGVAIGAGCGVAGGIVALGAAFVLGGIYATALLGLRHAGRRDAIPFGPFLAAGTAVETLTSVFA